MKFFKKKTEETVCNDELDIDKLLTGDRKPVKPAKQPLPTRKLLIAAGAVNLAFWDYSPEGGEIAELRVENPAMSLRELGENLSEELTRSGVNHRLKRLSRIYQEIAEKEKRKKPDLS